VGEFHFHASGVSRIHLIHQKKKKHGTRIGQRAAGDLSSTGVSYAKSAFEAIRRLKRASASASGMQQVQRAFGGVFE
jgi:hypothetical protein